MPGMAAETTRRASRHMAIYQAVLELLGEVGYDQMSMDAIAARARASKATIYRAWPHKPDLVMAALRHHFGDTPEPPDTGTLRGDLIAHLRPTCQVADSAEGNVVTGLLSAATRNPELSRTLFQCTYEIKSVTHETIIKRAKERGEIPDEVTAALLHEVMHAMVLTRKLWSVEPLDDVFVVHLVDDVLLPVLRHRAPRGNPT